MTLDQSPSHSWWWVSHHSPRHSRWLQSNLQELDRNVKQMLHLIEEDADSFAQRAEMFYQKRPELVNLVEVFYRAYRSLAERYDHLTGNIHHNVPKALQAQFGLSCDSPQSGVGPGMPALRHPSPLRQCSQNLEGKLVSEADTHVEDEEGHAEGLQENKDEGELSSSESEVDNLTVVGKLQQDLDFLEIQHKKLLDSYEKELELNTKLQVRVGEIEREYAAVCDERKNVDVEGGELECTGALQTRIKEMEKEHAAALSENLNLRVKVDDLEHSRICEAKFEQLWTDHALKHVGNLTLRSWLEESAQTSGLQKQFDEMDMEYVNIHTENMNLRGKTNELEHTLEEMERNYLATHAENLNLRTRVDELSKFILHHQCLKGELERDYPAMQAENMDLRARMNTLSDFLLHHEWLNEELERHCAATPIEGTNSKAGISEISDALVCQEVLKGMHQRDRDATVSENVDLREVDELSTNFHHEMDGNKGKRSMNYPFDDEREICLCDSDMSNLACHFKDALVLKENQNLAMMLKESQCQIHTLMEENQAHKTIIVEQAEEKRAVIRQLCFALDVLRTRNQRLEHALSFFKRNCHMTYGRLSSPAMPTCWDVLLHVWAQIRLRSTHA